MGGMRLGLKRLATAVLLGSLGWTLGLGWAQGPAQRQAHRQAESVTGVVVDPSGALVQGATVMLMAGQGGSDAVAESRTETDSMGGYMLRANPGTYRVVVEAVGFARFESGIVRLGAEAGRGEAGQTAARVRTLDIRLKIETKVERIEVPDELAGDSNVTGSAIVLTGSDVRQMPLDPVALLDELKALAGSPDAGLYVDGFSGGKLPSRDSIREIRINQNAYSAENDTNAASGMIQVSTKPGTDQLHGGLYVYGDDSALNAGNPFAPEQPGYYADGTGGSLGGSLNRRTSYYAGWDQMDMEMNSAIAAQTLDANLNQTPVSYAVGSPRTTLNASARLDLRAGANSTMMIRYVFDRNKQTNGGIGQLALASQGFDNSTVAQTLQMSNTQVIGTRIVNETRFQLIRARVAQTPVSVAPTIVVEGAFIGGGSSVGALSDHQDSYELQNYISIADGRHYLNLGGRLRVGRVANHSLANSNGEFIFSTLNAYKATKQGDAAASQFKLTAGSPDASVTLADAALFVQDDWKVRQNLTLSYGLRFETQTYIADHADWAPRIGFSWGMGAAGKAGAKGAPKYVVRGGAGIFYRRFSSDSALQAERQNGTSQQEYVVESPQFCPSERVAKTLGCTGIPGIAGLAKMAGAATVYRVSPGFHAPYYIAESVGLERKFGGYGTVGVTYLNTRGVHTQVTENVNAPLPGTYSAGSPTSGVRPNGSSQNIYEYLSGGVYRSSRLTTNFTFRASRFTAFGSYVLRYDKNDAESDGGFPSNQYDLGVDYGRSLGDVRHTLTIGENANLPFGIHTWGYLRALSGAPFNIVSGADLNGDAQFNDRPAFATDLTRPSVVATRWGTFDASPIAGQTIIPRNYAQGPGYFLVNLAVGKSFGVGPELKAAPGAAAVKGPVMRKYTVDFWVLSQNLLNHSNLTPPVGTLTSPLFGRSLGVTGASSLSADRVVDLQLSMRF